LSFGSIVCFGANGGIPHHEPDDTRLQLNDMVTIDMGCIYNDYCSDITRSFCFGEPNEKQKNM
jgi:Xaa-Pro dipeptidase